MSLESVTQAIREEISKLNQVLHLFEGRAKVKQAPRRKMSAAARKRISLAQKARWKTGQQRNRKVHLV
jgi:hypothetical protein